MRQQDLHNSFKLVETVPPQTVGTTGTGRTGKVIDRSGYQGVELFVQYGSVTATNATLTAIIYEGDVTGTMTSVANTSLIGTQAGLNVGQAATRTSGVSKNVVHKVGYLGLKRYVSANVKSTISSGVVIAAGFLLGNPNSMPVAS